MPNADASGRSRPPKLQRRQQRVKSYLQGQSITEYYERMSALNHRQVEAFRAVMLTGGVTTAAQLMNVTQPAVSRLIRDLQESLKLPLFERRGTRLLPTAEALSLYQEVE